MVEEVQGSMGFFTMLIAKSLTTITPSRNSDKNKTNIKENKRDCQGLKDKR